MASWPVGAVADDGRRVGLAAALGPGGRRVAALLGRIATRARPPAGLDLEAAAAATPVGDVRAPLAAVGLEEAATAAAGVDPDWLAVLDARRSEARTAVVEAGRELDLEAALNLAMLLATDAPRDDDAARAPRDDDAAGAPRDDDAARVPRDDDAAGALAWRVASGARLWLLGGGVTWALCDLADDPFAPWTDLVSYGVWPVGPSGGRLVVCLDPAVTAPGRASLAHAVR